MEQNLVLVADDDDLTRMMVKRMIVKLGYQVIEARNGAECVEIFEKHLPDVVLLDAMMPIMDGFTACEKINGLPEGARTPILMITSLDDDASVDRAFGAGASDYLTKPIHWAVLTQRVRRLLMAKKADDQLQQRIAQLDILHRIDRELGYTLNLQQVLSFAVDTAIQWGRASACIVGWFEEESQCIDRLASVGETDILPAPVMINTLKEQDSFLASIFTNEADHYSYIVDEKTAQLLIPLVVGGQPGGFIGLDNVPTALLDSHAHLDFLVQLAGRTAAAIEKTRTYQRTQLYANRLDGLYAISTSISNQLDQSGIIELLTRGLTFLLQGTSSFYCSFKVHTRELIVEHCFETDGTNDTLPQPGTTFSLYEHPQLTQYLHDGPLQCHSDNESAKLWYDTLQLNCTVKSHLLAPVIYEDTLLGIIVMSDSRFERHFLPDEIALVRSLTAHGAVVLQQATLFREIRDLEQIKSEMIRMASHDLRNPLGQVIGYFELLVDDQQDNFTEQHHHFVTLIRKNLDNIRLLLEEILNLEEIESLQSAGWRPVHINDVLKDVAETLQAQATVKEQTFLIELVPQDCIVRGSNSQLRQAFANIINNAIKYTPEGGTVEVRSYLRDNQFHFVVEDTGYGIPEARQERLFERFYRARTPGTEHIEGTGLGLSLVKSVIERHGGAVWFESEIQTGSTFGFWLPVLNEALNSQ